MLAELQLNKMCTYDAFLVPECSSVQMLNAALNLLCLFKSHTHIYIYTGSVNIFSYVFRAIPLDLYNLMPSVLAMFGLSVGAN